MKFFCLTRIPSSTLIAMSCILLFGSGFFNAARGQAGSGLNSADTSIEEKLVRLALQGPEMQNTVHMSKINEYELKAAQNTWTNLLAFSLNYNDQTFAKQPTTAYVYPKYFVGLTIPLGTLLSRTAVKSARENIEIGKNNAEIQKRTIREQVLASYKEYVTLSQLIVIQGELVNDAQALLGQSEEKFRQGKITIDDYTSAQRNNNTAKVSLINLKLEQDKKKLEIERMIGVKLETVLKK
jgi:outer membrane protein TolC